MSRKYLALFSIAFLLILGQSCERKESSPLILTIKSDKASYMPGDSIEISYAIKNIGSEPVGFYVADHGNIELEAFDLSGNSLEYYFHMTWQRIMPSLYPDEYVLLQQNQEWARSEAFPLRKGVIEEYPEAISKEDPGEPIIIHDGFYIDLPSFMPNDHILIRSNHSKEIKLSLRFSSNDPNPRNFSIKDCEDANISLDAFPDELSSNRIHPSVICEGGACPELANDEQIHDPKSMEDIHDLAMYCQHKTPLSKSAWVETLPSNIITIEIKE